MLLWKQVKLNNTQETDTRKRNKLPNTVLAGEMLLYIDLAILPFSSVLRYIAAGFLLKFGNSASCRFYDFIYLNE